MTVKLLTEHHLEFLSLKGGCTGSSEHTLVKMLHRWKSHATAHLLFELYNENLVSLSYARSEGSGQNVQRAFPARTYNLTQNKGSGQDLDRYIHQIDEHDCLRGVSTLMQVLTKYS